MPRALRRREQGCDKTTAEWTRESLILVEAQTVAWVESARAVNHN